MVFKAKCSFLTKNYNQKYLQVNVNQSIHHLLSLLFHSYHYVFKAKELVFNLLAELKIWILMVF